MHIPKAMRVESSTIRRYSRCNASEGVISLEPGRLPSIAVMIYKYGIGETPG